MTTAVKPAYPEEGRGQVAYAMCAALVVIAFLVVLNGFLSGAKRAQIDAVLVFLLIGLVMAVFALAGWKWGLSAIAVAFVSAAAARPAAALLAFRLLAASRGDASYAGLPPRGLREISRRLGAPTDPGAVVSEMMQGGPSGKAGARRALIEYCQQQPQTQALLREFGVSHDGLDELYGLLLVAGAGQWVLGHWVAASALAYRDTLHYVLKRRGGDWQETAITLVRHFEEGMPLDV